MSLALAYQYVNLTVSMKSHESIQSVYRDVYRDIPILQRTYCR